MLLSENMTCLHERLQQQTSHRGKGFGLQPIDWKHEAVLAMESLDQLGATLGAAADGAGAAAL